MNLLVADSFLLLSLNEKYDEVRKKYQRTNAIDSMLIRVS